VTRPRRRTIAAVGLPAAFAVGCLPSARIVTRLMGGPDIEIAGDGKPGAANVARTLGWGPGAATLIADLVKGGVPAAVGWQCGAGPDLTRALAVAPVVGHVGVVGGRGAATALGAAFAIDPAATAIILPVVVGGGFARRAALGVMAAALGLPLAGLALGHRRKAAWCALLPAILAYARLRGDDGASAPLTARVAWERFWYDREPRATVLSADVGADCDGGAAETGPETRRRVAGRTPDDISADEETR